MVTSASLTAVSTADQWSQVLQQWERVGKDPLVQRFPPAAGSTASANNHLNQHHASVLCRPKVTPTSGPTVGFFQDCHWAASAYRFLLNLSLISLTVKRSFCHPSCVRILKNTFTRVGHWKTGGILYVFCCFDFFF